MTEEEKKAKLEELRQKAAERKAAQELKDKEAAKKNEVCHGITPPSASWNFTTNITVCRKSE